MVFVICKANSYLLRTLCLLCWFMYVVFPIRKTVLPNLWKCLVHCKLTFSSFKISVFLVAEFWTFVENQRYVSDFVFSVLWNFINAKKIDTATSFVVMSIVFYNVYLYFYENCRNRLISLHKPSFLSTCHFRFSEHWQTANFDFDFSLMFRYRWNHKLLAECANENHQRIIVNQLTMFQFQ